MTRRFEDAIPQLANVDVPQELHDWIVERMGMYPEKKSAIIPCMMAAQKLHGWLSPDAFREVVDAEMTKQRRGLERGTTFLGTLGNNAPFIGLVGTVLGVIQAFQQLGNQNKDAMGNVMVGIAEALIATGVGLVVAIPAVVAYNVVNKSIADVEANVSVMGKYVAALLLADQSGGPTKSGGAAKADESASLRGNGHASSPALATD